MRSGSQHSGQLPARQTWGFQSPPPPVSLPALRGGQKSESAQRKPLQLSMGARMAGLLGPPSRRAKYYPLPLPSGSRTYPGRPAASMTLARVTSLDHTSYCHLRRPRTPQRTLPVCKPTRMFRSTSVASATDLQQTQTQGGSWDPAVCSHSAMSTGEQERGWEGGLLT